METKVIIENGLTNIVLTPENDFERDVIEKAYDYSKRYEMTCSAYRDTNFGVHNKHKFTLSIDIKDAKTNAL